MKRSYFLLLIVTFVFSFSTLPTDSYFVDQPSISRNSFAMGCWLGPTLPSSLYPLHNTLFTEKTISFSWQPSVNRCREGNLEYKLEVMKDSKDSEPEKTTEWNSLTKVTIKNFKDGNYQWRVLVRDQTGALFFSEWQNFTVDTTGPRLTTIGHSISSPFLPNVVTATITWNSDEPATTQIEWRKNPDADWLTLSADESADLTTHKVSFPLEPDTQYQYRVLSADAGGNLTRSAVKTFRTEGEHWGATMDGVVLNEFLPNPRGADDAMMPAGEWVELFNNGDETVNISGWYIKDGDNSHRLDILTGNTITSNSGTNELNLAPGEFAVVYRNGDHDFALNNSAPGDMLRLYKPSGWLADSFTYNYLEGDDILENKSIARFPDGSENWFDPIPSPGGPNILEPALEFSRTSPTTATLKILHLPPHSVVSYTFTYDSQSHTHGIEGSEQVSESEYIQELFMGSCSSGICTPDVEVSHLTVLVEIRTPDNTLLTLTGELP